MRKLFVAVAIGVYSHLPLLLVLRWCRDLRVAPVWTHELCPCGPGVGPGVENSSIELCRSSGTLCHLRDALSP